MNFPGGTASLPDAPTCSGLSGSQQVWHPEPPHSFDKLSDAALDRLAAELCTLLETELDGDAGVSSELSEYIALLVAQTQEELLRRASETCPQCGERCNGLVSVLYDPMYDGPGALG